MARLLSTYHKLPPRFQNIALSAYGLLLRQARYGKAFHQTLARLESGRADPFQDQSVRLDDLVKVALNHTEHYGRQKGSQPFTSSEITVENITEAFPVLEKSLIRSNAKSFHNNRFPRSKTTLLKTSGTTGTPLELLASKQSRMENYAFFNLFLRSLGIDEFNRSATFGGRLVVSEKNTTLPFWRKNFAMKTLFCSAYHLSSETIPFYIEALEQWKPVYIDSYPSAIYEIASYINTHNIAHNIHLKAVVTSSETLGDYQRDAIETAFRCPVFDQYGCAEMAVMANQQKDGRYFMPPQYAIAEVLDDNDKPVRPGQSGHLVCTGLLNQAMPLIRYRVGDIVKTSDEQIKGYPHILVLDSIEGRKDDVVIAISGYRVGRLSPAAKGVPGVCETQIIQKTRTSMHVNLVVSREYDPASEAQLRSALQARLGTAMEVDFEYMSHIPREKNGKFKSVKSEL